MKLPRPVPGAPAPTPTPTPTPAATTTGGRWDWVGDALHAVRGGLTSNNLRVVGQTILAVVVGVITIWISLWLLFKGIGLVDQLADVLRDIVKGDPADGGYSHNEVTYGQLAWVVTWLVFVGLFGWLIGWLISLFFKHSRATQ